MSYCKQACEGLYADSINFLIAVDKFNYYLHEQCTEEYWAIESDVVMQVYMYMYKTKIPHHNSKHCDIMTFVEPTGGLDKISTSSSLKFHQFCNKSNGNFKSKEFWRSNDDDDDDDDSVYFYNA